jgi:hypothetical protein
VDQFIETWASESAMFDGDLRKDLFERLVQVWAEDICRMASCGWCEHAAWPDDLYLNVDDLRHARAHLVGKLPVTDGRDSVADWEVDSGSDYGGDNLSRKRKGRKQNQKKRARRTKCVD